MVGAGATTGGTMDLANLVKPDPVRGAHPPDRLDHVRGVQAHREGPRAAPPPAEDRGRGAVLRGHDPDPAGPAGRATRSTTTCATPPAALDARRAAGPAAPARAPPARQRRRRDRRGRAPRCGCARPSPRSPSTCRRWSGWWRAWRASPRSRRRCPRRSGCARSRRTLGRVVFGQAEAVRLVARAIKRSRAGLGHPDHPAGCFLFTGPDRRRQDRAGEAAGAPPGQRVPPLRHERVHGEARGGAADRRAARLRRLRAGRPAGRRGAQASLQRGAARRDREGAPRPLQHPAAGDGPRDADRQQRPQGGLPPGGADHDLERGLAGDERAGHRLRGRRGRRREEPRQAGDRAPVQPRVPQPARRDRDLRAR